MTMTQGPLCHDYGIRGYGNPSSGVVVVGIGPGRDEAERTKRPFTGTSGRLLDALLKHAGWLRDKIYATNVVCWFNNSPSPAEIEECRPRFVKELRDLSPKLIIAAGAIASEALLGTKRRPGQRGAVLWSDYWNAYILDTHHPSFALQSQSMNAVQDIIRDLSKIEMVLGWPPRAEHTKVEYSLVNALDEAQAILNCLPHNTPVSLDIETSNPDDENIDAYSDQLLCFSVSYLRGHKEITVVFPTHIFPLCVRDGTHVRAWDTFGRCPSCDLPREALIFHNDVQWLFQYGQADIPALNIYLGNGPTLHDDTMLMSVCVDERPRTEGQKGTTGQHGLKPNGREWLGAGFYNDKVKPFYKGKLDQVKPEDLYEYNAKDAAYTRRLPTVFLPRMAADGTDGLYRNLLIPATQTFIQMQMRGIKINWDTLQELACGKEGWFMRYFDTYKELQLEAADIGWPSTDINLNSNPQLAKFFYQIIGLDITKYTKGGKPSVDKETLDLMDHPFAAKLRAYRTLDTMVDYLMQVYAHLKWDGLIHPQAYVSTTRTGRTSYRNPSLQNFPKDYTVGADYARFRETIEPHNTNTHELIESDYCLVPETRVLRSDLVWATIGDVVEGDELVGFDEELLGRDSKFCSSVVERVKHVTKMCYKVTTDRGTITASEDHMWCAITDKWRTFHGINMQRRRWWWHTTQLEPGDRISYLCDPWDVDTSYEGGYVAGFLDGEGFCSRILGFGQNRGPVLNRVLDILSRKGFDVRERSRNQTFTSHWFAGQGAALRALGTFRPTRLLPKGRYLWDGVQTWSKNSRPATVLSVECVGEREVVAVQTSSKTFVAEGMLSHNCQIEVWLGWAHSRDPVLLEHLQSGDVHTRTAEGAFNTKREFHSPEAWAEYRQRAKHIRFGIQYGEGAKGLTRQPPIGIGGTVAAAQKYIDNYKRTYPTYTQWMLDIQREALTKGFLRTPDGRVMRFPIVMDHKQLRQAINFPIQNTASAYNLKSMIALEHPDFNQRLRALNSWVILNIHDYLAVESDRRYRTEVAALVREVMEAPKFDGFPSIKVDIKVGPNLGKMEKLK